ncbi:hypothetical protein HAX54_024058 [Datura stramonium]|uniref:Uncharacterized protein n=1 Tax=Datura stramonium TaxID=4076 RepID=A0ABS8UZE5_DATST|nr:hypothetical protein [Datura stramonium]
MEGEIVAMRELLGVFPRPPQGGTSSGAVSSDPKLLQKEIISPAQAHVKLWEMPQVSKKDAQLFYYLSGFEMRSLVSSATAATRPLVRQHLSISPSPRVTPRLGGMTGTWCPART